MFSTGVWTNFTLDESFKTIAPNKVPCGRYISILETRAYGAAGGRAWGIACNGLSGFLFAYVGTNGGSGRPKIQPWPERYP